MIRRCGSSRRAPRRQCKCRTNQRTCLRQRVRAAASESARAATGRGDIQYWLRLASTIVSWVLLLFRCWFPAEQPAFWIRVFNLLYVCHTICQEDDRGRKGCECLVVGGDGGLLGSGVSGRSQCRVARFLR